MSHVADIDQFLTELDALSPKGYFIGLHIRFASPLIMFQTYDSAWIDIYTERGYALRDPMIMWGFTADGAIRWSDNPVPDTFGIMAEARDFGLKYGMAVSCGPLNSRTIAGCARDDREYSDVEIEMVAKIVQQLHTASEPPGLTQAQKEALRLIAAGDRHAAAAAKLGISESALKARLNSARTNLMARTTAEAIQRAKDYRLI
jgi:LuxR family transcriptional regulator